MTSSFAILIRRMWPPERREVAVNLLRAFFSSCSSTAPNHTSEANMACGRINGLAVPRCGSITAAIIRRAQMRASFQNLAWNPDVRHPRIKAVFFARTTRILWNAARFWRIGVVARDKPIVGPLPDIPDHVMQAIAVRWKRRHWRST